MDKNLWIFKEARSSKWYDKLILFVLMIGGIASLLHFANWWFTEEHIDTLWIFALLSFFFWYSLVRIPLIWNNYFHISKPEHKPAPEGLTVAIFTTSYAGEPLEMIEKTLEACSLVRYPHTTYLLDNTRDPAFREAAERHGAVWLELVDLKGAKAGKVNRALELTTEDYILVLDPDHIPFPEFLDHTLGYFDDPKVGFVQVSQAYYNQDRSFTARAAAEQTYSFYGPTQMGFNGMGCAVAIGSNCTFRRAALESIGGHAVGLAEDLQTSMRIHSAGWTSVYNPVIVSRGLVPEDFGSFCKQQLKWARGTFEVLFVDLPKYGKTMTRWQKLSYTATATYYLGGFVTFFFTLFPFVYFVKGEMPARMSAGEFVLHGWWFVLFSTLIYIYSQRWMCDRENERGFHWRGMILKYASWPVFFYGFILTIIHKQIPYIPTEKKASMSFSPFARPLVVYVAMFIIAVLGLFVQRYFFMSESELVLSAEKTWGMLAFALMAFIMSVAGLVAARGTKPRFEKDPWEYINVKDVGKE